MDPDTDIGGAQQRFPVTNQSAIAAARSEDHVVRQRAFDTILTSYWKPGVQIHPPEMAGKNEDAKDLTQGFFANAFEKNHFASYDARKASFQTFLRTSRRLCRQREKSRQAAEARRRPGPFPTRFSQRRRRAGDACG